MVMMNLSYMILENMLIDGDWLMENMFRSMKVQPLYSFLKRRGIT